MGEFSVCLSVQLAEMLFLGQLVTTAFLLNFVFVEGQGQVNLGDLIGAFLELIDDSEDYGGYSAPEDEFLDFSEGVEEYGDYGYSVPEACSLYLEVRTTTTATAYPGLFGIYTKQPDLVNGKPWYRGTDSAGNNVDNAIFFSIDGYWHMGPEEWIDEAYTHMYQSGLSECPGNHDSWKRQNSENDWIETAVTVTPESLLYWVDASNGQIPRGAQKWRESEYDPGLYLVRAEHDGGFYPGTFLPEEGAVDIAVRGEVISKSKYQVAIVNNGSSLINVDKWYGKSWSLFWYSGGCTYYLDGGDKIGEKIIPIPYAVGQDRYGKPKYMCRIHDDKSKTTIVGEYDENDQTCTISAGDKAITMPSLSPPGVDALGWALGWEVLVLDPRFKSPPSGGSICTALGFGPEYVSPIAAVGSYTSRGQDCSENRPCERWQSGGRSCCAAKMRNGFPSCKKVKRNSCERPS